MKNCNSFFFFLSYIFWECFIVRDYSCAGSTLQDISSRLGNVINPPTIDDGHLVGCKKSIIHQPIFLPFLILLTFQHVIWKMSLHLLSAESESRQVAKWEVTLNKIIPGAFLLVEWLRHRVMIRKMNCNFSCREANSSRSFNKE